MCDTSHRPIQGQEPLSLSECIKLQCVQLWLAWQIGVQPPFWCCTSTARSPEKLASAVPSVVSAQALLCFLLGSRMGEYVGCSLQQVCQSCKVGYKSSVIDQPEKLCILLTVNHSLFSGSPLTFSSVGPISFCDRGISMNTNLSSLNRRS